jgi:glucose-6-phosphate isomerase
VLNHILGGGAFTSRLFQEVREKRGLAYSVGTSLVSYRAASMTWGYTATKNERVAECLDVIAGEMARLKSDGPGEEELVKAKDYLTGSYALGFDTSTKIAHQLAQIAFEGLGIDYIARRNALVAAVTEADIRRAGRPHARRRPDACGHRLDARSDSRPLPTLPEDRSAMALQQSIDLALATNIGASGLPQMALDAALSAVETAVKRLRQDDETGALALLHMPRTTDDLGEITEAAGRLRADATDVVFLGTGGSSLGGQTLAQLGDYAVPGVGRFAEQPRVHFLDNLDPLTFAGMLERLPLETSRFVAISKSGGTGETLMQTIAVLTALDKAGLRGRAGETMLGLSEPLKPNGRNALRALLEPEGVRFLPHHTGSRRALLGADQCRAAARPPCSASTSRRSAPARPRPTRRCARERVRRTRRRRSARRSTSPFTLEGKSIVVLMAYADRLERLTRWWVQLWAESLGKDGKGSQPVAAIGPVDQHSQQQLYLAGPKDKLFTVVTGRRPPAWARASTPTSPGAPESRAFGARRSATSSPRRAAPPPTPWPRTAADPPHPPRAAGRTRDGRALMHFMLETILTGYAMGVDPFDQPAVEESKILAKKYLAGEG